MSIYSFAIFQLALITTAVRGNDTPSSFLRQREHVQEKEMSSFTLSGSDQQALLDKHNELRSKIAQGDQEANPSASDMDKMVWNDQLATVAEGYAQECVWAHNPQRTKQQDDFKYVGENLFLTTGGFDADQVVQSWYDEVNYYNYNDGSCSYVCGHYTQVVWADSSEVGCAAHLCDSVKVSSRTSWPNALVVVCNYGPGGNYYGQKPYTEGEAGTKCPKSHPNIEESTGLCVSGCTGSGCAVEEEEKEEPEVMIAVL